MADPAENTETAETEEEEVPQGISMAETPDGEEDLSGLDFGDDLDIPGLEQETEGETEEEEGETAEGEGETAEEEEGEGETAEGEEPRIPKSRFDEQAAQYRARIADLENKISLHERQAQQQQAEPAPETSEEPFDFAAKRREYVTAVQDGDAEKAVALDEEIRLATIAEAEQRAAQQANNAVSRNSDEQRLASAVEELAQQYPLLDGESLEYNPEVTQEVLGLYETLAAGGVAVDEAIRRAARLVLKDHDLYAPPDDGGSDSTEVEDRETTPTPEQIQKKMKKAKGQPPNPSTSRENKPELDVLTMREEDFDKLTADQLAVLRGDVL